LEILIEEEENSEGSGTNASEDNYSFGINRKIGGIL